MEFCTILDEYQKDFCVTELSSSNIDYIDQKQALYEGY